jgi:protease I
MANIAVVLGNMYHDKEFEVPTEAFKKAGHNVTLVGAEAGSTVEGLYGGKQKIELSVDDAKAEDFDALFIPGGFSPDILRADQRFVAFARKFAYLEKPIFAICHGPQLLINAEVLRGRRVTGYTSIQIDLKNAGAQVFDEEVVVDGGLVTSRTPDDLDAFTRASLDVLASR